jgi:hypothetical protein
MVTLCILIIIVPALLVQGVFTESIAVIGWFPWSFAVLVATVYGLMGFRVYKLFSLSEHLYHAKRHNTFVAHGGEFVRLRHIDAWNYTLEYSQVSNGPILARYNFSRNHVAIDPSNARLSLRDLKRLLEALKKINSAAVKV